MQTPDKVGRRSAFAGLARGCKFISCIFSRLPSALDNLFVLRIISIISSHGKKALSIRGQEWRDAKRKERKARRKTRIGRAEEQERQKR